MGRIGCFAKILDKLFKNGKTMRRRWSQPRWEKATEDAIQGLIRLQNIEQLSTEPREKEQKLTKTKANTRQQRQQVIEREACARQKQRLYDLWKEFVMSTRVKEGQYEQLPTLNEGRCLCGKARISYPHWPPTSTNEADTQFEYCIDERNTHRRPLVINWWRHFANMEGWTASEKQQRYKDAETTIREASPIVQQELEKSAKIRKRSKGWSCRAYCEKVLTENKCECLSFCTEHRDECPTHSQQ